MDLSNPISSVIPGAYGAVLAVLTRTDVALSGRRVASLTRGPTSRRRVDVVLSELAHAGVVLVQEVPPAKLYRLNRQHVAAAGIEALASMRDTLRSRMRTELTSWQPAPVAAWLFGSAARGEASADSDIDLLLVRPPRTENDAWDGQVDALREAVLAWSGNELDVLSVGVAELHELRNRGERLIDELLSDAIVLAGSDVRRLVGRTGLTA